MNGMNQDSSLLSYITEEADASTPNSRGRKLLPTPGNRKNNGLAIASLVLALLSVGLCVLIIPSMLGIALATGALVIAVKRGLPKRLPIVSMAISIVTLIVGMVGLIAFMSFVAPEPKPYIPAGFTYDENTGIAYKYNPVSNIPCDVSGVCDYTVTLYQALENRCADGGTFKPDMDDIAVDLPASTEAVPFPGLKAGEQHELNLRSYTLSNGRLVESSQHPIFCNL